MSREDRERLRGVLVFNPGFFFGEILRVFEIRARSQSAESKSLHGVDELLYRSGNSRVRVPLDCQGFVHGLGGVA